MLLAIKYNEDQYFDNKYYARVGGVSLEELNFLEREILSLLDYELYVDPNIYKKYLNEILVNSMDQPVVLMGEYEKEKKEAGTMGSIKTLPSAAEMDMAQQQYAYDAK
eukprot:TRINITY_DN105776_c0_g1_i1.p3 TRINITY_DN105776_c0_g1~~TRINITY_DN105776_c0_g1_i1.p3  ORF type:complete len:108 (-),score=17.03 TRINITY_DN105776_c0_g1_i1:101-424(-)